jgi:four helix bundle protein
MKKTGYTFSFENMIAWKESRNLVKSIYFITAKYPKEELYALSNQIRRASISICSNLAEGSGRYSPKDQAHFYQMAYSSLMEVLNQLYTSLDMNYIDEPTFNNTRDKICAISLLITKLRKSCFNKPL